MGIAPDGTVYLVDDYSTQYTFLYRMEPGGGFGYVSQMQGAIDSGSNGDGMDIAVAVSPDESLLAVLLLDYNGRCDLSADADVQHRWWKLLE